MQGLSKRYIADKKGFTLVELIVVMAILGILMGIAVPRFTGVMNSAKEKADEANMAIIKEAAELWYWDTGQTGAIGGSEGGKELGSADFGTAEGKRLVPDYLKKVPEDPTGMGGYLLKVDNNGKAEVTHPSPAGT